jgi:hypothetical protein
LGDGLVEGPNGYEVAVVYFDDCPPEEAETNARAIAEVPAMVMALRGIVAADGLTDLQAFTQARAILARIDAARAAMERKP